MKRQQLRVSRHSAVGGTRIAELGREGLVRVPRL